MSLDDFDSRVARVAALGEPVRRALYRYVVAQPSAVSRDEAAEGAGVPRHVAKFHLDKLAEDGLLEAEYRRVSGRRGPGAGRPAKLYRRAAQEVAVSLPERRYDLAGRLLARAIVDTETRAAPVREALRQAARDTGRSLGEDARRRAGPRPSRKALLTAACDVLGEYGYEPHAEADSLTLANCPFHALAQDYTDLVCRMNLDLLTGLATGLEHPALKPRLDPASERCCVTLPLA